MIESCGIYKELVVVAVWVVHREAEVNHLYDIMLEDMGLENERIFAVFLTLLV